MLRHRNHCTLNINHMLFLVRTRCAIIFAFLFFLLCVSFAQAMLDVAAHHGWLVTALNITNLVQMVVQGRWIHDSSLLTLPNIELQHLYLFRYVILLSISRFPISFHFLLLIVFERHCCARECSLTNQKQNSVMSSQWCFPKWIFCFCFQYSLIN